MWERAYDIISVLIPYSIHTLHALEKLHMDLLNTHKRETPIPIHTACISRELLLLFGGYRYNVLNLTRYFLFWTRSHSSHYIDQNEAT